MKSFSRKMPPFLLLISSFILVMAIEGCAKRPLPLDTSEDIGLINNKLFSDRYQKTPYSIVLVHLKTPPLLETSSFDKKGELLISRKQLQNIIHEQARVLKKIREISTEIKLLFEYKFTLNALALSVPPQYYSQISEFNEVSSLQREAYFEAPKFLSSKKRKKVKISSLAHLAKKNKNGEYITSVSHIQATKVHNKLGIQGRAIKVGIIDTGIDYTHKMLGGPGEREISQSLDPATENSFFPNHKVVGGFDFVGKDFNPSGLEKESRLPRPDRNPIDERMHGTHVAAIIGGKGDNEKTYSGVAPEAKLYALKVFGKEGGTSESIVLAAIEWAMDPNGDYDPSDRLDILNLSLGSPFGKPKILYALALKNLARSGMITAIAAGNASNIPYIVNSPSTVKESLSVAASIDPTYKNWHFPATGFLFEGKEFLVKRNEASFSPFIGYGAKDGEVIFLKDSSPAALHAERNKEIREELKGKVALLERKDFSFYERINELQKLGAIGAVIINNIPHQEAFAMTGGKKSVKIPSLMISKKEGEILKEALKRGLKVTSNFKSKRPFAKPELIDSITKFSSRGPRLDGLLKPEITAPGYKILSAFSKTGDEGVELSGTSMATPHMTGVLALFKEKYPKMSTEQLKALAMNHARPLKKRNSTSFLSLTRQGSGLVQAYDSLTAEALTTPSSLNLGKFQTLSTRNLQRTLHIQNLSSSPQIYSIQMRNALHLSMKKRRVKVAPQESQEIKITLTIEPNQYESGLIFHEGVIELTNEKKPTSIMRVPVFGVSQRMSQIQAKKLDIFSSGKGYSFNAPAQVELENKSPNPGDIQLFNLIKEDERKPNAKKRSVYLSRDCDLQAVGYRLLENRNLQIGIKIYNPLTLWKSCELSLLFDKDGDGKAEQELAGIKSSQLSGLSSQVDPGFYSVLLDFSLARKIRINYESALYKKREEKRREGRKEKEDEDEDEPDYTSAIIGYAPMISYENSHLAIINVDPKLLVKGEDGKIHFQVTTFNNNGGVQYEDTLGPEEEKWLTLSLREEDQSYRDIPQGLKILGKQILFVELTKGFGDHNLMIVYPSNRTSYEEEEILGDGLDILKGNYE